uniref:MANSC domain-containing protein n=1 Tax=Romanomermis culicivorax TaxID=13658 RepID=A0A915JY94_ROMCU
MNRLRRKIDVLEWSAKIINFDNNDNVAGHVTSEFENFYSNRFYCDDDDDDADQSIILTNRQISDYDRFTVEIEFLDSYLLYNTVYNHNDDIYRKHIGQMRREIHALQLEINDLEKELSKYRSKIVDGVPKRSVVVGNRSQSLGYPHGIYRTSGAAAAAGDDCFKYFDVSNKTIIKTSESLKNGAKFLKSLPNNDDEKANDRRRRCAKLCCETEFCNMVVLQEKENGFCYLFDCGPINDLKCTFSDHENHVAMGLMIERGEIFGRKSKLNAGKYAKYRESKVENHEGDLQALKTGDLGSLRTSTLATKLRKLGKLPFLFAPN